MTDNTRGAALIAKYAKTTGKGFDKTRTDIIHLVEGAVQADVVDAFGVAHVGVAKLIEDMRQDIHGDEKDCDRVFTSLALIISIASIMQVQHSIHEYNEEVRSALKGAPERIIKKDVILAASPHIKGRINELSQLTSAMIHLFMANVVSEIVDPT